VLLKKFKFFTSDAGLGLVDLHMGLTTMSDPNMVARLKMFMGLALLRQPSQIQGVKVVEKKQ